MYWTDETMEEIAQFNLDSMWEASTEDEIPTEYDVESFEIQNLADCMAGMHTLRFEIISGRFTAICEDGCS